MARFDGYPAGKQRIVPVPAQFFNELLPQIDSLDELRLCLYFFWRLDRMEGEFRFLRTADILADPQFMSQLGDTPAEAQNALSKALEAGVVHGALLRAEYPAGRDKAAEAYYFLNSARGRAAVEAIQHGEWRTAANLPTGPDPSLDHPNIYRLYEENIGPRAPMIAETLREAEQTYPMAWIEEAIRLAVEHNKRSWRYAAAILERWQQEGRDERKDRRDSEAARRRYAEWDTPRKPRR
jgi:DnaD/phage-associated family protein